MTEKISADSAFSIGAIQPKRKHGINEISRKGQFSTRESDLDCEIDCELI